MIVWYVDHTYSFLLNYRHDLTVLINHFDTQTKI
jgi:hypothetical protein